LCWHWQPEVTPCDRQKPDCCPFANPHPLATFPSDDLPSISA
jgi:hypothetical protein